MPPYVCTHNIKAKLENGFRRELRQTCLLPRTTNVCTGCIDISLDTTECSMLAPGLFMAWLPSEGVNIEKSLWMILAKSIHHLAIRQIYSLIDVKYHPAIDDN